MISSYESVCQMKKDGVIKVVLATGHGLSLAFSRGSILRDLIFCMCVLVRAGADSSKQRKDVE